MPRSIVKVGDKLMCNTATTAWNRSLKDVVIKITRVVESDECCYGVVIKSPTTAWKVSDAEIYFGNIDTKYYIDCNKPKVSHYPSWW